LQLLSPITPHLTEEIYQTMYAADKGFESLQTSPWPKLDTVKEDERAEKRGDIVVALIAEIRREKAEKRMPLNTPISKLTVYAWDHSASEAITDSKEDIIGTCKIENLKVLPEEGTGREVIQYPHVQFIAEYQKTSQ